MGKSQHKKLNKQQLKTLKSFDELLEKVKEGKIETKVEVVEKVEEVKQQPKKVEPYIEFRGIKILVKDVEILDHAIDRGIERLGLQNRQQAKGYLKGLLNKCKPIGQVVDHEGKEGIMFATERTALILSTSLKELKTVKRRDNITYEPLKNIIYELHAKELRKIERKEQHKIRKLETLKLEANAEIAHLRLRIHKSRSQSVQNACRARIHAINESLQYYKNEIASIQTEKRHIANSMVSVVV